jgi:hypothetical protein
MNVSSKNWVIHHRIEIALAVLFCLLGFIFGIALQPALPFRVSFDDKINPVELLSLFVTIVLVWIISSVLEKKKQAEIAGKEILLKRVELLLAFVLETAQQSTSGSFLYAGAASAIKKIELSTSRICKLMESNNLSCDEQIRSNILNQTERLVELLTNTPVHDSSSESPQAVKVQEGKLIFSAERALDIQNAFYDLEDNILILEIAITRM